MRRESDRHGNRITRLLLALTAALGLLACVLGYKAIVAIDSFQEAMDTIIYRNNLRKL